MTYDHFMNGLFYVCVDILRWGAKHLGMSYEELNIWVFVVIHPLITVLAIAAALYYWAKARRCTHCAKSAHSLHIQ